MKTLIYQLGQATLPDCNHSDFSDLWKAFALKLTTNLSFFFSAIVLPSIAVFFAVKAGDCKMQNALWF